MSTLKKICFDRSKNEYFQLNTNYKLLHGKLKAKNWIVEQNDYELRKETLEQVKIFVIAGPRDDFSETELELLHQFLHHGGSILMLLCNGPGHEFSANLNSFLENYGLQINNDAVIRPHYYKNFHPRECIVGGGVVCESMWRLLLKQNVEILDFDFSEDKCKIHFHYPYGATLNVKEPGNNILMTSGPAVYPFNRPLVAYHKLEREKEGEGEGESGKLLLAGTGYLFHDKYLAKSRTNMEILEYFITLLGTNEIEFSYLDFIDIEINEQKTFTDIGFIADRPKLCLVDSIGAEMPENFTQLFDMRLFSFSNRQLKEIIDVYKQLNIVYEPLKIIKPMFKIPLPSLQLSIFYPIISEPKAPALELYDLDDVFSSPQIQMDTTTARYLQLNAPLDAPPNPRELRKFILECGQIAGILNADEISSSRSEKDPCLLILDTVVQKLANYRQFE